MPRIESEQTLMRIFIGEGDRWEHRPLYEALVELFRRQGFAGATVLKGAMGFGAHSITHTDKLLRLSQDLPVVVEVIEDQERIEALLPQLDLMLQGGLVTLEKARVLRYAKAAPEAPKPC
jgi:PII-like signaling protein